jgi:hypothetical protein
MVFTFKMVFCLIPLTVVTLLAAAVVTAYMLANHSKLSESIGFDNDLFVA